MCNSAGRMQHAAAHGGVPAASSAQRSAARRLADRVSPAAARKNLLPTGQLLALHTLQDGRRRRRRGAPEGRAAVRPCTPPSVSAGWGADTWMDAAHALLLLLLLRQAGRRPATTQPPPRNLLAATSSLDNAAAMMGRPVTGWLSRLDASASAVRARRHAPSQQPDAPRAVHCIAPTAH